ncbi:hypothetical protein GW846_03295 [Candidatus Gracilibacteria bacterium]|nr:hypothetical protein [Candidatus Gracilibacteria bacterium]
MTTQIKKHVPMVGVQVAFGLETEVLYWEGLIENFNSIYQQAEVIRFPRHNRNVVKNKIKDWWEVKDQKSISYEEKLAGLDPEQRTVVKFHIGNMKKNINREPTITELDSIITTVIGNVKSEETQEFKTLNDVERFKTSLQITKTRIAKITTGSYWGFNPKKEACK